MEPVVNGRGRSACTVTSKVGGHVKICRGEVDQGVQLCTRVPNLEMEEQGEGVSYFLALDSCVSILKCYIHSLGP